MTGIPTHSIEKIKDKLQSLNKSYVIIDQVYDETGNFDRKVILVSD